MNDEIVESLVTNALAYRAGCVSALHSHREQARAVLTALDGAGYVITRRTRDRISPANYPD